MLPCSLPSAEKWPRATVLGTFRIVACGATQGDHFGMGNKVVGKANQKSPLTRLSRWSIEMPNTREEVQEG